MKFKILECFNIKITIFKKVFAEPNMEIPLIFYIKHMHVVFGRIYPWKWDLIQCLNLSKWSSMVTLQKIYFRVHYFCFFLSLRLSCLEVMTHINKSLYSDILNYHKGQFITLIHA